MTTKPERPEARFVRPGEAIAMRRSDILETREGGRHAFFWLFGGGTKASERREDVAIVHVRDGLEHHDDAWGSDNYEAILRRVTAAMTGEDDLKARQRARQEYIWSHRYDDGYVEPEPCAAAVPPSAVVLCIDSPGGVVAGLNETVKALQKLRADTGIPLVAYVNEMAASAAYALACACDEIICPPSAIIGSIGVISTMCSQAEADKKAGFDIRLITSGARKADGHVHAPITDAAVDAETARVEKLAAAFYRIASKARGISIDAIRSLEAGIFLGKEAKAKGLADAVMSFDDAILGLSKATPTPGAEGKGNETDRRAAQKQLDRNPKSRSRTRKPETTMMVPAVSEELTMAVQLTANIKKLEAAIAKEKDAKKLAALQADLEAYKKVEKHIEHTKSEEDDDPEDDEPDGDEEDDEEEEKKAAKPKGEAEDEEEEASSSEEEKKAEKKASLSLYRTLSASLGLHGKQLVGAVTAIVEKAGKYDELSKDVAALKATQLKATKSALIDEAVAQRRITRTQAKDLRGAKLSFVKGFLAMHKTPLVNVDESAALQPDDTPAADVPKAAMRMIDQAIAASGKTGKEADAFREALIEDHRKAQAQLNGAGAY